MHRAAWRRLLATLVALWFPLYAVEPAALLACPMHSAAAATQATPVAHHGTPGSDSHDAPAHHTCTCAAECCASTVVALSGPAVAAPIATTTLVAVPLATLPACSHAPRVAEHVLPFATAPPLA